MILIAPILLPFIFIVLALLINSPRSRTFIALFFALANLVVSIILVASVHEHSMMKLQVGSWPAPFGITIVADRLSAFMLLVSALVFAAVMLYSVQSVDEERLKNGYFLFAFGFLMGGNGSFLAGDLFNLYVWFEVM
jgi:multicomponent Na+:H+ antiporter subunit D